MKILNMWKVNCEQLEVEISKDSTQMYTRYGEYYWTADGYDGEVEIHNEELLTKLEILYQEFKEKKINATI